jgi:hypothetical protein
MSSNNPTLCQICNNKKPSKKLSILVCDDDYAKGLTEMRALLKKLKEQYQQEEEEEEVEQPQPNPEPEPEPQPQPTQGADKYGIKEIYASPATGQQMIYMNMDNPTSDPLFRNEENANLKKESDGSWSMTGTSEKQQVRLELWQDPGIRDCEITVYANYMQDLSKTGSYAFQTYRGGGTHSSTKNNGCEGAAYKGRVRKDKSVVFAKETKHPDYTSNKGNIKKLTKDVKGNYLGVKQVIYNLPTAKNGRTPVKLEMYIDESGMTPDGKFDPSKQNWQKYAEYVDAGGWGAGNGGGCPAIELGNNTGTRKGDEILNTTKGATQNKGNLAAYRTDGAKTKIKYFSFRKIKNPAGLTS